MTKKPSNKTKRRVSNEFSCGCRIVNDGAGCYLIVYCPTHKAAFELLRGCEMALQAFERNSAIDWNELADIITSAKTK